MDTTSLPPDDRPPVAGPRRANRGLLWASALAVVVLAIATIVAFTAGDGSDDAQKLDPDATLPVDENELTSGRDPSGQVLPQVDFETFGGETVTLETAGRPLVINFWASWCIPCVAEMPALEKTYQANSATIDFLGLQMSERAESGEKMIEQTGITYPVGRDPRGDVMQALGGRGLPRTVLVAADGTVAAVHNGEISQEDLQALIDEKLAG